MPSVPVSAHPLARGTPTRLSSGDFDDPEDSRGDNSDAQITFNVRGGHSEHPEDDMLGDLACKPVIRYLHTCVMFDELLVICAHIL
jgi:hypothetical protein